MSGWKLEHLNPSLTKLIFSINTRKHSMMSCKKKYDNLEFVQPVHFEFINSSRKNGTKNLLSLDDSCAEIFNSKDSVEIAAAGRHRRFRTIYIEHILFHQSELGRDVQLRNTHIVLFKSPRSVHQLATLGVQLGLRSALVDWYRDATSVPSGQLLTDLSPRTDDRLRYCTITGKKPSNFMYPTTWNIRNIWTMNTLSLSTLQALQRFSLACKDQFPKSCPKEFTRFLSDCIVNLLQRNLTEIKRSHLLKYRDEIHELSLQRTTWRQRRSLFSSPKVLLLIKT